jgi:branched-chain amino acid transport system permease protein
VSSGGRRPGSRSGITRYLGVAAWLFLLAVCLALPLTTTDNSVMTIAIQTFILTAVASAWNILGGFAGQISLGQAAFFGLGTLITRELWLAGAPLPLALIAAVVGTALFAVVIGVPMLRFRGIYFSIGTLALAVAIGLTISNLFPGITSMPVAMLREYTFTGPYYLALGSAVVAVAVALLLRRSVVGLGMMATRDDEEAANAMGVDVLSHKLSAFAISAALTALAGGAFAFFSVSYYPNFPFTVPWSFEPILVTFVGGIGTIVGPLLGSAFFVIGRDTLAASFEGFQVIAFGVLFIIVVLLVPGGMVEGAQRISAWAVKLVKGRTTDEEG